MRAKRILIIDEHGFAYVCSALFEDAGYKVDVVTDIGNLSWRTINKDFALIVTSHPYGTSCLGEMGQKNIPIMILLDNIDENTINAVKNFDNCYCMIKPLDYEKFRSLASQLISGKVMPQGGFNIV